MIMNKTFLFLFILVLCFKSSANEVYDNFLVKNEYGKLISHISKKEEMKQNDYFYISVAQYFNNDLELSYLNSVREIYRSPFAHSAVHNSLYLENKLDLGPYSKKFRESILIKFCYLSGVILLCMAIFLFFRKKRVSVGLSILLLIIMISYYFTNGSLMYLEPGDIVSLKINSRGVGISPSTYSSINKDIRAGDILILRRKLDNFYFVEKSEHYFGWVEEGSLNK